MANNTITLLAGREKSLLRRHPWIFSGAVSSVQGNPALGETVKVLDSKGKFLAWAAYSPHSQIRARVWSFDAASSIGLAKELDIGSGMLLNADSSAKFGTDFSKEIQNNFLTDRLKRCLDARISLGFIPNEKSAFRLVNAENDFLPGCIVDYYAGYFSIQLLSAGWENFRNRLTQSLLEIYPACKGIIERSDSDVRLKEGLEKKTEVLFGEIPAEPIAIEENGVKIFIDMFNGHKTGYYLDQRNARKRIGELAKGKRVLNCFCYTGGFGLFAARGGAEYVRQVDASTPALEIAKKNEELNGPKTVVEYVEADVFTYLRKCRDKGEKFDLIILDPPKFAENASQIEKAARGYKDINLLALKLLTEGGMLATFSCSGHISPELFQKIIADSAIDANRPVQILESFRQAQDHPVLSSFPEGLYLKGLLAAV